MAKDNGKQKVQLLHVCLIYCMDHLQLRQQLACVYLQSCHNLHTAVIAQPELKAAR